MSVACTCTAAVVAASSGRDRFGSALAPSATWTVTASWAVVGAIKDDDGGTDRGAVWILFLNKDRTARYGTWTAD